MSRPQRAFGSPHEPKARPTTLLVLGGARSGKSAFAQAQVELNAERRGLERVFIATAQAFDGEMASRIADHRGARDARWSSVDAPYDLPVVLGDRSGATRIVLVDCLTLWLSNLMLRGDDIQDEIGALEAAVGKLAGPVVFVSNEVGSGIVPDNPLGRSFRDAQGRLNQRLAQVCDTVVVMAAGLPLVLKPSAPITVELF